MPINTSFAGNIPWLLTEPPTAALARGSQIGEGIAHQRLAQQQINLQEASQQEAQAYHQAQTQKLNEASQRLASQELSRQIGMTSASAEIESWKKANPDASDDQISRASAAALMKYGPQIFSGNSSGYLKMFDDEDKNRITEQAKQHLFQQKLDHESTLRDKNRIIEELGNRNILSKEQIATVKDATTKLGLEGKRVVQDSIANLNEAKTDAIANGPSNDLTNIVAQPIKGPDGTVVAFALPNGKGGIHYESPAKSGQIEFGVTPTGQHYMKTANGAHILHDAGQEAKLKVVSDGLKDVSQRIRDIESSTRLKPEEQTKRLAPLLKQRDSLEKELQINTPVTSSVATTPDAAQPKSDFEVGKPTILQDARDAIKAGKPRDRVIQRLRDMGITEEP